MKKEEAYKKSLEYFNGNDLQAKVFIDKYALRTDDNNFLESTPNDMFHRAAKEFARIENKYKKKGYNPIDLTNESNIYNLFKDFKYIIPQGSVLAGIGNDDYTCLSNCFVLDSPFDSIGGIIRTDSQLANVYQRRGGAGIDISTLRPSGAKVRNAAKTTTGAVSFIDRFSNTTKEIGMNGRRGAAIITMDIRHPDIMEFIDAKIDLTKVNGANISVKVNKEFIDAVKNNEDFLLKYPVDENIDLDNVKKDIIDIDYNETYKIYKSSLNKTIYIKKVKAVDVWNKIIKNNVSSAEPGIIYWDRQNDYSLSNKYPNFNNIGTNPSNRKAA